MRGKLAHGEALLIDGSDGSGDGSSRLADLVAALLLALCAYYYVSPELASSSEGDCEECFEYLSPGDERFIMFSTPSTIRNIQRRVSEQFKTNQWEAQGHAHLHVTL